MSLGAQTDHLPHALIVDCSSDGIVASRHAHWLARGVHVVSANINAIAGELEAYNQVLVVGNSFCILFLCFLIFCV